VLPRGEAVSGEKIAENGAVGQFARRDAEVGVGRVFGASHVGVARVDVNRLGAHEHDGVKMRLQGVKCVE
jgi:hypothetical protein